MEHKDIVAAVKEAISDHPCRFDVDEKVVDQLITVLETVGEGNVSRGIQRVLKNHEWLTARRAKDPEYTKNHEAVSMLRKSTDSVTEQIRRVVLWVFVLAIALVLVFGVKLGLIKAGG